MKNKINNKVFNPFVHFFKSESASGLILLSFAVIAIIIANSSFAATYNDILHTYVTIGYKEFSLSMSLLH